MRFSVPVRSTDGDLLVAPVTGSLCRAVDGAVCRPTTSFPAAVPVSGVVEWTDVLPPDLRAGSPRRLSYTVELLTPKGRSAGPSNIVFAAAGEAPPPVAGLRAEGSHQGVVLHWVPAPGASGDVLVRREDLSVPPAKVVPPPPPGPRKAGSHRKKAASAPIQAPTKPAFGRTEKAPVRTIWLHAEGDAATDAGGLIDSSAQADEPYTYTAERSRTVTLDGHRLELRSDPSPPVPIKLNDTYPPGIPHGLMVAGFPIADSTAMAADLVWQPDSDADLAGYNVYRQALDANNTASPAAKLNDKPLPLPSFHDATPAHGVRYRYQVTAVDRKGNESPRSAAADLEPIP